MPNLFLNDATKRHFTNLTHCLCKPSVFLAMRQTSKLCHFAYLSVLSVNDEFIVCFKEYFAIAQEQFVFLRL